MFMIELHSKDTILKHRARCFEDAIIAFRRFESIFKDLSTAKGGTLTIETDDGIMIACCGIGECNRPAKISIDNGQSTVNAETALREVPWEVIADKMGFYLCTVVASYKIDDHAEFLEKYLELSPEDIVIA